MRASRWTLFLVMLSAIGCAGPVGPVGPEEPDRLEGSTAELFGATVSSHAELENGLVSRVVMTLPLRSVENAPVISGPQPFAPDLVLELPEEVWNQTFVRHLQLFWELEGHPPGIYQVPHFDLHFYRMRPEEVAAIDCTDFTPVPEERIPEGYFLPPLTAPDVCVPGMGYHAVPEADLAQGARFEATMILGYYLGDIQFIEPMFTQEMLLARQPFELEIPLPRELGSPARLPTRFSAVYQGDTDSYELSLSDFREVPGPLQ
jgi:hypothetical protein